MLFLTRVLRMLRNRKKQSVQSFGGHPVLAKILCFEKTNVGHGKIQTFCMSTCVIMQELRKLKFVGFRHFDHFLLR